MGRSKRDKANRLYYVGLFVFFGLMIAFCTSILSYRLEIESLEKNLTLNAEEVFDLKINDFESYTGGLEDIVAALRDTSLLYQYLEDPSIDNYEDVAASFRTVANSNSSLMQVRYIDEFGMEKVRADWPVGRERASLVSTGQLQDKKHRYYYKEASQIPPFTFWYSKVDLNMENGKIESPEKPVLRVASPVYLKQKFRGIVIINVHVKAFLNNFLHNSVFDISLIDSDGYYLISYNAEHSWSKYRESGLSIDTVYPEYAKIILHHTTGGKLQKIGNLFVGSFGNLLEKDGGMLLLHADDSIVQSMKEERQKAAIFIVAIIFLLSVPLALLISRGPAKLHKKISLQNRRLSESIDVIDRNVLRGTLDLERNFQEVSSAFASTLGVEKSSIVGKKYDTIYCNMRPNEYYDEVWESLERDGSWGGELQHSKSNGECYWADTVVLPKTDEEGVLVGYSVIHQDITDKKRIEELSITDEMTGLHNRRYFNVIIKKELGRVRRERHNLIFAMLDIDFFKQYNDNYGHQKGDEVLKEVSSIMKDKLSRASDYCFRLGGEEFGILFSNKQSGNSYEFVDLIRKAIEERAIEHKWSAVADVVTVSIGMQTIAPDDPVSVDLLYKIADKALYTAKNEGRNRLVARTFDITDEVG
ncbi:MAG: diguanylate cyclase (GGDEF)-like protein/PAS domain S-box-containing protein [Desulforhopalus sp.]|jgi:diguanylate cyclase (GGDEF)-like protein/PAS domain S-box-containing protein